jgi:hypothetical protein
LFVDFFAVATGAVFFSLLALLSPKAALYLVIPTIALAPEFQFGGVYLRPDDLMIAVIVVAWALRGPGSGRTGTPVDRPLFAYFAVGLLATLWGVVMGTADLWSTDQLTAAGFHVVKRVEFLLFYLALTRLLQTTADVKTFVILLAVSMGGLMLYGMSQFSRTQYIALAPFGSQVHEVGLGGMLGAAIALGFLVTSRRFATSLSSGLLLVGSALALPFTLGRNFLASTAAIFLAAALSRRRVLLLLIPVALLIAPILLPPHVLARVMTLRWAFSTFDAPSVEGWGPVFLATRITPAVAHAWDVLVSSPLFGWGLASLPLGAVDSEYVTQFVYTGIVGLLVFVILALRIARMAKQTYRSAEQRDAAVFPLITGLRYCLLGYAVNSLLSPSISSARPGAIFIVIVALIAVLYRSTLQNSASKVAQQ